MDDSRVTWGLTDDHDTSRLTDVLTVAAVVMWATMVCISGRTMTLSRNLQSFAQILLTLVLLVARCLHSSCGQWVLTRCLSLPPSVPAGLLSTMSSAPATSHAALPYGPKGAGGSGGSTSNGGGGSSGSSGGSGSSSTGKGGGVVVTVSPVVSDGLWCECAECVRGGDGDFAAYAAAKVGAGGGGNSGSSVATTLTSFSTSLATGVAVSGVALAINCLCVSVSVYQWL